jgi:diguanylate cyclase (GGDEF)-like protein
MDIEIYNNLLQKLSSLLTVNGLSIKKTMGIIKKDIEYIIQNSNIGKISFEIYKSDGTNVKKITLYSEENNEEILSTKIAINNEKYIVINVCPKLNQTFDFMTKKQIEILSSLYVALFSRAYMNEQTMKLSGIDMQTGLLNTKGIIEYGKIQKSKNKLVKYICVFMNIKDFNIINQKYGPNIGDIYLKAYADSIKNMASSEERVARLGGNNFVCLIKKEKMKKFIEKINSMEIQVNKKTELIKSRMGIYEIEKDDTINMAIDNAIVALNMCKQSPNKDYFIFDDELKHKIEKEVKFTSEVKNAMENGEFIPFYQPKVDSDTNTLIGAEALVRWNRNDNIIYPGEFIQILEREDLICALDLYMLRRVCADIKEMMEKGLSPVKVSVNFSKKHFTYPNFAKQIIDILNEYNTPCELIEIELTETIKEEDYEAMTNFVQSMKEYGLSVSVDDFGTGYSSFSLIKELNVSTIKIDKIFVDHINRQKDRIVVESMIKMIKKLGIGVIAEGVETLEQIEILNQLGCNNIQGYYYDKPLPKEEYVKRLSNPIYK